MDRPQIKYETGVCKFGTILAARTGWGLCFVAFNRPIDSLIVDLENRFKRFACVPGDADLNGVITTVEDPEITYCRDIDLRGTDFQRLVWTEIRAICFGHTMTYGRLADAIGRPKAVRAVAQACGANPLAVVVPCHRVVGTKQQNGYRWGRELKQQLLEWERYH